MSPGNSTQWDRTAELTGRGGHIKLIFPGVTLGMTAPPQQWQDAVSEVYARDLVPVIRIGPNWGTINIRKDADDASHLSYTQLAGAYAAAVAGLPLREGWPLVIEVHNEANLCYEWTCEASNAPSDPAPAGWIHYTTTAAEYASFLRDVTNALRGIGDPRILVINGGLAPGGTVECECGGSGYLGGITSLDFLQAMEAAVPGVHAALDGFATVSARSPSSSVAKLRWGVAPTGNSEGCSLPKPSRGGSIGLSAISKADSTSKRRAAKGARRCRRSR